MPIINEGTSNLPSDIRGRYLTGLYNPDADAFYGWRGDSNHSARVALWGTNNLALLTSSNPGVLRSAVSNALLQSVTVAFASNLSADTITALADIDTPSGMSGSCVVMVTNPSTDTALTVSIQNRDTFVGPVDHYPEIATFSVPANTPEGKAVVVTGWLAGNGGRITLKNTSQAEVAGFTSLVNVRQL